MPEQHTSGPWKFVGECEPLGEQDGRAPFQVWQGNRVIAEIASSEEPSIGVSEGIANARLVAAAPEMFAALCKLCMVAEEFKSTDINACQWAKGILAAARAAIAKAKGAPQP